MYRYLVVEVEVKARRDGVLHDVGGGLSPIYLSLFIYIHTYLYRFICIYVNI